MCEIEKLSRRQRGLPSDKRNIYFFGRGKDEMGGDCTGDPEGVPSDGLPIFNASNPGIVVVARDAYTAPNGCPKPKNGQSFAIYYFGDHCSGNGWGGVTVNGIIGVEGSFINMTGSVNMNYTSNTHTGADGDAFLNVGNLPAGRLARIPGSWRDF